MYDVETCKKYKQQSLDIKAKVSGTFIEIGDTSKKEWSNLLQAKKQDQNRPVEMVKQKRVYHKDIFARNNQ